MSWPGAPDPPVYPPSPPLAPPPASLPPPPYGTTFPAPPPPPSGPDPSRAVVLAIGIALIIAAVVGFVVTQASDTDSSSGALSTPSTERIGPGSTESPGTTADPFGGLFGGEGGDAFSGLDDCGTAIADSFGGSSLGGASFPNEDLADQVTRIAETDEAIRELVFTVQPNAMVVTPGELEDLVQQEIASGYPDDVAEADGLILGALGAVPTGTDMKALVIGAFGSQVIGFYDPETRQIVVGVDDPSEPLTPDGELTMAHELDHALTDQALGLPQAATEPQSGAEDEALAAQALVEGDATLVMTLAALQGFGTGDPLLGMQALLGDPATALDAQAQFNALPAYLQQQILFPYDDGLRFVCALYAEGGFAAVDQAYARPPTTTAQILFPDRYLSGEGPIAPVPVAQPDGGWTALPVRQFGAADLSWLLRAPGGDPDRALDDIEGRVAAWAGGELYAFERAGEIGVGLTLVERSGERDLCETMQQWVTSSGLLQAVQINCGEGSVRVGIARDEQTAGVLAN